MGFAHPDLDVSRKMNIFPVRKKILKYFYKEMDKLERGEVVSITLTSESKILDKTGKKMTEKTINYLTRI